MLGTVLVASEGVNRMLAAPADRINAFIASAAQDPIVGIAFADISYKRTDYERFPFSRMMINAKSEIVPLGVDDLGGTSASGGSSYAWVPFGALPDC
ncbi:hypothetical protein [Yimella sp. cx-51]|uniref:hypothetical protein n=1 Tax=Yimella sp. cx-51 TaxID=2770551 RepID=UPI00165DE348|nr:hypothetical protein [Yimella sp. cx-51]MBC9957965.1 hypothetical protein [Yimella sp. cx-51]QTH38093.1 hypothetical protein J5M86_14915 [Yimella sp. cx-51]